MTLEYGIPSSKTESGINASVKAFDAISDMHRELISRHEREKIAKLDARKTAIALTMSGAGNARTQ